MEAKQCKMRSVKCRLGVSHQCEANGVASACINCTMPSRMKRTSTAESFIHPSPMTVSLAFLCRIALSYASPYDLDGVGSICGLSGFSSGHSD